MEWGFLLRVVLQVVLMDKIFDPLTWSILSFLIGTLFGHWLAIHRDRRAEFNELADGLFLIIEKQAASPNPYPRFPYDDLRLLRRHMSWYQRIRFDAAIENYEKASGPDNYRADAYGQCFYKDDEIVKKAAKRPCRFLHRR